MVMELQILIQLSVVYTGCVQCYVNYIVYASQPTIVKISYKLISGYSPNAGHYV